MTGLLVELWPKTHLDRGLGVTNESYMRIPILIKWCDMENMYI